VALVLTGGSAGAWVEQVPQDFITGGGWFIIQSPAVGTSPGNRANFGWHGGVKNGDWWGNGNYIDHGTGLHVHSRQVTGYLRIGTDGGTVHQPTGTRDICGIADANGGTFFYRVRMKDAGEPGRRDEFGIALYTSLSGTPVYFAFGSLGDPTPGGGNIQLHRGNNSNTAPATPPSCPPDFFSTFAFS
jgi:hypothetical protein